MCDARSNRKLAGVCRATARNNGGTVDSSWLLAGELLGATDEGAGLCRLPLATPTLPPATTTNHYLAGQRAAVLVDPAAPAAAHQSKLAAWMAAMADGGGHVQALFLTHHHRDHVGAAAALRARTGLPVWAHPKTAELLAGDVPVDRLIDDGEAVAENHDGSAWIALHTPGHAPGHLALHHAKSGTVVAGDLVAGEGTILIDPRDGDMGLYLQSLARVETLGPARLAPAHGPVLNDAVALLRHYQAHRRQREAKILQALTADWAEPADLLPVAYADVSRLAWPLALRSATAHLLHLQQQGLAESRGGAWRRA